MVISPFVLLKSIALSPEFASAIVYSVYYSPVTVSVTVDNSIAISTSTDKVDFGYAASGSVQTQQMQVTVYTKADANQGYTLTASTDAPSGAMQNVDEIVTPGTATEHAIPAISGNAFSGTKSEWGIGAYNGGTSKNELKWQGLGSGTVTLKEGGKALADGDTTSVLFGVYVKDDQAKGTYSADVTFTAVATDQPTE